ncbi:MAG: GTP-binding protein [Gemmatimonadetes bacterium]|nr:GTP-binding protein [Gemmatimonadota bacterium]
MYTRSLYLLALGGLIVGSPPLTARQSADTRIFHAVLHDTERPDYLQDIVSMGLPPIYLPAPPTGATPLTGNGVTTFASHDEPGRQPWRAVLRDEKRPDYMSDVVPPSLQPIHLPPPPVGETPAVVRGVYLNAWVFGGKRFYDLVRLADTTEVNSFVIDVKDATGFLMYRSSVPTAIAIGANGLVRARDVRQRLALLQEHGIHPVARIVVGKDPLLANGKPEWAVHHVDGGLWKDRFGDHWVDVYRDSVWLYAADLAREAVLMGFAEIQLDYIRFPDEPAGGLATAIFPARQDDQSRRYAIASNLGKVRDHVKDLGVPLTVDVFGLTTSARTDMGIGQYWDDLSSLVDVLLPMVYPSHYYRGAYGLSFPNAEPYAVVSRALAAGVKRNETIPNAARIRPWLQSFSIRRVRYGPKEIRAQIDATYDVGLTDWVLWNASGRYPAGAFLPNGTSSLASPLRLPPRTK